MTKLTKQEVDYSIGMVHSHCGKVFSHDTHYCKHFSGGASIRAKGTCEIVEGSIDPVYWCKEYSKQKQK